MHDGCSGSFESGLQVLQKIRMMGFSIKPMPAAVGFKCHECDGDIEMTTFEYECPHCNLVYAVTPCHASDVNSIVPAGKNV